MSDSTASGLHDHSHHHHAHVVVHPVVDAASPFRRVDILGTQVGKAYSLRDVAELCRRASLEELDLEADGSVQWIGGGPHTWEAG